MELQVTLISEKVMEFIEYYKNFCEKHGIEPQYDGTKLIIDLMDLIEIDIKTK